MPPDRELETPRPLASMRCGPCNVGDHRGPGEGGSCECSCHRVTPDTNARGGRIGMPATLKLERFGDMLYRAFGTPDEREPEASALICAACRGSGRGSGPGGEECQECAGEGAAIGDLDLRETAQFWRDCWLETETDPSQSARETPDDPREQPIPTEDIKPRDVDVWICCERTCEMYGEKGRARCSDLGHQETVRYALPVTTVAPSLRELLTSPEAVGALVKFETAVYLSPLGGPRGNVDEWARERLAAVADDLEPREEAS